MTTSALLVIDAQAALLDGAFQADRVLEVIVGLQARARDVGAPVVFLQHNHASFEPLRQGAAGWRIHSRVAPRAGEVVIGKTASDAFYHTELAAVLRGLAVSHVVVTGLQTEFCVDATCRAALSQGFAVTLVADGHTTGDAVCAAAITIRHHNYALGHLAHPLGPVRVVGSQDVRFT